MGSILDDAVSIGSFGLIDTDFSGKDAGKAAAGASRDAANIQAQAQREALNYLKEREALPQQFREAALQRLGGAFGVPGGDTGQQFMTAAQSSPIYQAIMGNLPQMEEAVLRNQSATGALRTGATDLMLAENQRKLRAEALGGVLSGIQGMAQIPSNANNIAGGMAGIGQTQAQGITAGAQATQQAQQNGMNNMLGLGNLGLAAFTAFCDPRLKSNPVKIGVVDGVQIYEWDWNEEAANLGLYGKGQGPMADEIKRFWPERVIQRDGYLFVRAA